mgnify:CR=1 FL=1
MAELYRFSGAGNDFVIIDGRQREVGEYRTTPVINDICSRYGLDGLMILLEGPEGMDFAMEFYNPDGTGGMMCGNGGRCITAFAEYLGIRPGNGEVYHFQAPDGPHTAEILARDGRIWTVRLKMRDVRGVEPAMGGWFLDTGTRHLVLFVDNVDLVPVSTEGPRYRHDPAFAPVGTNVNFVEKGLSRLKIRTFEKGVENETLACGTGITASAIAARMAGIPPVGQDGDTMTYRFNARRGDRLTVTFRETTPDTFTDIYLTGPAELEKII